MKRLILVLAVLFWPLAALSQTIPAFYDVVGVAGNDVLNIRSGPGASHDKVGALGPYAKDVEVVALSDSGTWGLVNHDEGAGWVSMRFMLEAPQSPWHTFGEPLFCGGTEPFWNLTTNPGNALMLLDRLDSDPIAVSLDWAVPPIGRPPYVIGFGGSGSGWQMNGTIRQASCNDGMSDFEFGLEIDLFVTGGDAPFGYAGCCSLSN